MSETTYTVEFAKSGKAKCKKCKEAIPKGEIRIGAHTDAEGRDFAMVNWHHPKCFNLPRKLCTGAGKITPEEFVSTILEDKSEGEILPAKAEELAEDIGMKVVKEKSEEAASAMTELRDAYLARQQEQKEGKQPASKKLKSVDTARLDAYGKNQHLTVAGLGDVLQWNRQYKTGNKSFLMEKVIDGEVHGRLAQCPLCSGHLKLTEDGATVLCNGSFDEDMQIKIACGYSGKPSEAPRFKPWYSAEPTEEENTEIDRLLDEASGKEDSSATDPDVAKLVKAANKLEWKLNNRKELKESTGGMVDLLLEHDGKKVDIPQDRQEAIKKVGPLIVANREKKASEIIPVIVKEFGFLEVKKEKAAKKEAAIESMVGHPKNAGLVAAFQELSQLYFKESNKNAGASYTKAANSIKGLDFEVTEGNAKSLGKAGKNKVDGIGAKSAEKMLEFVQNGTIDKLEEKRADAA